MKLLIVEGNPKTIWQAREPQGGMPYHRRFIQLLNYLGKHQIDIAFPVEGDGLPDANALSTYDGILLTGSSLNAYDTISEVTNQLDFAEACFASGVPIYGSCWGLQIAVMVAGGKVGKSPNGREFGIAKDITLTEAGQKSPFYAGKPPVFDALCIHEDDTHELPENAVVLAENAHSTVQAMTLRYKKSEFFGVQYHPEFTYDDIYFLSNLMEQRFIEEGIFHQGYDKAAAIHEWLAHPTATNIDFNALEIQQWLEAVASNA